ncbi:hypothetical protein GJAV_G00089800 [Gymnothorax javanicus]|nr:hypothetical protein GJAV_G00089800 [Gymnothorax javanicus]
MPSGDRGYWPPPLFHLLPVSCYQIIISSVVMCVNNPDGADADLTELCLCCHISFNISPFPRSLRRECLPEEWFCGECDVLTHKKRPLHNRETGIHGFLKAIPPSTCVQRGESGQYFTYEQACILPTVRVPVCPCEGTNFTLAPGKPVILITINGRYDLHMPVYTCETCYQQWTPEVMDLLKGGYWPATSTTSTVYTVDLLRSFQELKVIAPGLSRQAFAKLLEQRTEYGGRSGSVNGDALQRSFLELVYSSFEVEQLCCAAPFTCPACSPQMLAIAVDGNRKLYRFQRDGSSLDPAFFNGLFVAEDGKVQGFVENVQKVVKHTHGRGTCGDSQWAAAKEACRSTAKLDEEGMEVAVCRHGFLLKALNMYRGEIFAYPLYLQQELLPCQAQFFAMDVACKYWPYLEKCAAAIPALQDLRGMRPFLSVMHARAHSTKCEITWSGRHQEGAGAPAGEEVEQVNSYLSRCALTTKYMSKPARVDMLTVHAMGWNKEKFEKLHQALSTRYLRTCQQATQEAAKLSSFKEELNLSTELVLQWVSDVKDWAASHTQDSVYSELQHLIEGLYISVTRRKQTLYRQNDSNKIRHRLRRKLADDKKRLMMEIGRYNCLNHEEPIDLAVVEQALAGQGIPSPVWPWEGQGSANLITKKKVFEQHMLVTRLEGKRASLC